MVLDYFTHQGLYLLGTYNLRNNYGNVWNDTWNSPYGNGNENSWDPYDDYQNGYGDTYGNVMSEREFSSFLQMLKKQSFDDRRLDFLNPNSAIEKKEYFSILISNCVAVEKNKR